MFDGVGEAAFALRPAWHGLGRVLDDVPSSEEMIEAAHLGWSVGAQEMVTSEGRSVPGYFATVREDTGAVLGVVSDRYKVVQNRDAFNFLDSLLQDGVIRYESAGALKGGRVVWALARMPSNDEIALGDVSRRYILFSTTHDGSGSVHALPTRYPSTDAACDSSALWRKSEVPSK